MYFRLKIRYEPSQILLRLILPIGWYSDVSSLPLCDDSIASWSSMLVSSRSVPLWKLVDLLEPLVCSYAFCVGLLSLTALQSFLNLVLWLFDSPCAYAVFFLCNAVTPLLLSLVVPCQPPFSFTMVVSSPSLLLCSSTIQSLSSFRQRFNLFLNLYALLVIVHFSLKLPSFPNSHHRLIRLLILLTACATAMWTLSLLFSRLFSIPISHSLVLFNS